MPSVSRSNGLQRAFLLGGYEDIGKAIEAHTEPPAWDRAASARRSSPKTAPGNGENGNAIYKPFQGPFTGFYMWEL